MPDRPHVPNPRRRRCVAVLLAGLAAPSAVLAQERRVTGVDENGWPVFGEARAAGGSAIRPSGSAGGAAAPVAPGSAARPVAGSGAGDAAPAAGPSAGPSGAPAATTVAPESGFDSALHAVWARVGSPAALAGLRGVAITSSFRLFDADGAETARRDYVHEADLQHPARDRLQFLDGRAVGRDGRAAFHSRAGVSLPVGDVADELRLHGFLLRAPWCLGDGFEFVARTALPGTPARVALEFVAAADTEVEPDPRGFRARVWLVCAGDTMQPEELRYLAGPGRPRRVALADWRRIGEVVLPWRRRWLDADGRVVMEVEMLGLEHGLALPPTQFQRASRP